MTFLLDTQIFLWMQAAPERLSSEVRELIVDTSTKLLLSAASAWEIAIKHGLGKLHLPEPPSSYVPDRMRSGSIAPLPVDVQHALGVAALPPLHRDPFDRLLVVQTHLEGVELLTADRQLEGYEIPIRWAD